MDSLPISEMGNGSGGQPHGTRTGVKMNGEVRPQGRGVYHAHDGGIHHTHCQRSPQDKPPDAQGVAFGEGELPHRAQPPLVTPAAALLELA